APAAMRISPPVDPAVFAQVSHFEERFRQALGTRVALNRNGDGSGKLVIHFYNDGDLESLLQTIAGDEGDDPSSADGTFPL
ncbi:MAG: hypothetical protein ACRC1H_02815, partial [Caldilineaceae bacterium]